MALFSRTKKTTKKESVPKVKTEVSILTQGRDFSSIIVAPRVTEKAVRQNDKNVFTFVVAKTATKHTVSDAVKALYNVTPVKVNIVNKKPQSRMSASKGRPVSEKGMKKAYVYLKEGDRISIV